MSLENSPSLNEYRLGLPERPPDLSARRRRWLIIGILVLLVISIWLLNIFSKSTVFQVVTGTGNIAGRVVGPGGAPVQAEVFVPGTNIKTQTDQDGRFALQNVPAGEHSLIVGLEVSGYEFPLNVQAGESLDLGDLRIVSTPGPGD
jgi:hypothetical protein